MLMVVLGDLQKISQLLYDLSLHRAVDLTRTAKALDFNVGYDRGRGFGHEWLIQRSGLTSLEDFCSAVLLRRLDKGEQQSDWSNDPLSREQRRCEFRFFLMRWR